MVFMQRIRKASTRKGKKALLNLEPKFIEDAKQCFLVQGRRSSEMTMGILKDLYTLKKPNACMFKRKNDITPFEDASLLEKFARQKNASLFSVASHSKKRPHNLILGRTFDHTLLDMIELGVDGFKKLIDFKVEKIATFIKPCLVFNGPAWEQSQDLIRLKSIFIDFFQWEKASVIRLQGLEHVLSFTATQDSKIFVRSYKATLKKSGQKTPRVELVEIGPSMDLTLRRTKLASEDLMSQAIRKPKELRTVTKKNISKDSFGSQHARIHLGKQDVSKLQTRKMKGLKRTPEEKKLKRKEKKQAARADKAQETSMAVEE